MATDTVRVPVFNASPLVEHAAPSQGARGYRLERLCLPSLLQILGIRFDTGWGAQDFSSILFHADLFRFSASFLL